MVCSCPWQQSLTSALLICAASLCLGLGSTALHQFRVSVRSSSCLFYQPWAGSWQEVRAPELWALVPVAMSGVSSKLGKCLYICEYELFAFIFFFFSIARTQFYIKDIASLVHSPISCYNQLMPLHKDPGRFIRSHPQTLAWSVLDIYIGGTYGGAEVKFYFLEWAQLNICSHCCH